LTGVCGHTLPHNLGKSNVSKNSVLGRRGRTPLTRARNPRVWVVGFLRMSLNIPMRMRLNFNQSAVFRNNPRSNPRDTPTLFPFHPLDLALAQESTRAPAEPLSSTPQGKRLGPPTTCRPGPTSSPSAGRPPGHSSTRFPVIHNVYYRTYQTKPEQKKLSEFQKKYLTSWN
jgi:hypothetical protein